jgi:hypothetical protein
MDFEYNGTCSRDKAALGVVHKLDRGLDGDNVTCLSEGVPKCNTKRQTATELVKRPWAGGALSAIKSPRNPILLPFAQERPLYEMGCGHHWDSVPTALRLMTALENLF